MVLLKSLSTSWTKKRISDIHENYYIESILRNNYCMELNKFVKLVLKSE